MQLHDLVVLKKYHKNFQARETYAPCILELSLLSQHFGSGSWWITFTPLPAGCCPSRRAVLLPKPRDRQLPGGRRAGIPAASQSLPVNHVW